MRSRCRRQAAATARLGHVPQLSVRHAAAVSDVVVAVIPLERARQLSGILGGTSGRPAGVGIYDFGTSTATMLSSDQAFHVKWLADSRRLVYFAKNGSELVVLDMATRARTVVPVRLPWPASEEAFAISPDNRTIYYGASRAEADIWIVERK